MTLIFLTQHERSALTFFQTDDSDSDLESERLSLLEPVPGTERAVRSLRRAEWMRDISNSVLALVPACRRGLQCAIIFSRWAGRLPNHLCRMQPSVMQPSVLATSPSSASVCTEEQQQDKDQRQQPEFAVVGERM